MSADSYLRIFRDQVQRDPEGRACGFLGDGETLTASLRYGELDRGARRVADLLAGCVTPGARAVLVAEPGPGFVEAFFGCLYAGVIAVPVAAPAPPRPDVGLDRLRRIVADSRAECLLVTADSPAPAGPHELPGVVTLYTGGATGDAAAWRDPGGRTDTVAFLQYTSGSTRAPRGVVVDQGNLAANVAALGYALHVPPGSTSVSWLPLYHDMGLIAGMLLSLSTGAAAYLMSPLHFLQRPARWVAAVSRFRGYVSGAPNFAFDLTARKVTDAEAAGLDLSCWQVAFNGAEPVRPTTLERFGERFARCGLRPENVIGCYGLAEATLVVAGTWSVDRRWLTLDRDGLEHGMVRPPVSGDPVVGLAAAGRVPPGHRVEIVDPRTCAPCAEDVIGEVWVSGPSIARGYWGPAASSELAFGATLADGDPAPFLRTGDLGFTHDGLLYLSGRIKDLLIVRGRNVQPHDVEDAAYGADPRVRPGGGAAFHLDDERVVLVAETTAAPADLASVAAAIRRAVLEVQQVALAAVYLVPPRVVPKTSSGKVRRQACRQLLADGELDVLFEAPDTAQFGMLTS